MSASVGTARAGTNRHTKSTAKANKGDNITSSQQTSTKTDSAAVKMQPTQEQLRLAQMMNAGHADTDPKQIKLIKELAELTGKKEDVVVIALHDTGNDADRAVMLLLEGGEEQGEWKEQGGKRKKKASSQKDTGNHVSDEQFEGRNHKDREDRDGDRDKDGGSDRQDIPPRRGRRNGGPPPRLARGRGRDRGVGGDRDRDRINTEDWDTEDRPQRGDKDRSGGDRGRSRGRGGFGRKPATGGGNRGRFNNSGDRDNRGYNRVPRFDKMNNSQPLDGPEIDTWTNETAETNTSKDTDWDNWKDSWVNEEDQWTGTLEETKVFTPSQMKLPETEPAVSDPPSSLGQRLDVGSLFIETAKFSKAPDYTKPGNDAYINQFNQAATESIKNSIGIGSSSRQTLGMTQTPSSNPLGLSNIGQNSAPAQNSVLSSLPQDPSHNTSMQHTMSQLSQISQSVSQAQAMSQIGMGAPQAQVNNSQAQQSRMPSVMQQQQSLPAQASINNSLQQRPKPQKSKLPPPSKIPSSAVEMPGHIPLNTQLDLQFGIDFGTESSSFGFGGGSGDSPAVTSSYSTTTNGTSSVISNHLNQGHVSQSSGDGSSVSNIMPSSSTPSKVPSGMEPQTQSRQGVFHNSVYPTSQTKSEGQSLDRDQNKINDSISFPSSQLERKTSPLTSQRPGQTSQNLSSGSITSSSKNDVSNNLSSSSSSPNYYSVSSYQNHQKGSIAHSTSQQPQQNSTFPGQYSGGQSAYSSTGQTQFPTTQNAAPFPSSGQAPQYNSTQNQFSSGQSQYSTGSSTLPHQTQYPAGAQNNYSGQYSGYQNSSSFPSHPPQSNFSSSQSGGASAGLYPASSQPVSSYTSQSNSYQSPSAGSYHTRDSQANVPVSTQSSSGVSYPSQAQSSNLKPASTQSGSSYNSQSFNASPTPLQTSQLNNKLGDSLSKMSIKDAVIENHQSSQFEHTSSSSSSSSVPTSLSLPSATSTSLSSGTNTMSSTSTATSVTSTSRIVSMPSTCKAPPNLPPGVPLMGQYIMGQSTMPPFYSVQPPLYGYEDVQLLQQRVPLQTGSYYDMSPFPAPAGSTLPTGRDQQPPIPNVPFSGSSDTTKLPRVDAQSPNASTQPQNAHSAAQQPLFNFHYSYIYPSTMFPGAAGLQYPTMFPIPPVTNTAAHAGTTATTQFQKTYPSHVYSTKGYDELNQAQDFSKSGYGSSQNTGKASGTRMSTRSGSNEITPNAYNKSHTQGFDKQGYHGGTPPPFSLPLATATQAGPLGAPTTPYGAAPFLPMMAAHQPHSQMMHHPIQQDSSSSSSRGLNQTGSQSKTGASKAYAGPPYWNN